MEKFPLPSFSLLEKIQSGGVKSITAAKSLLEKGDLSQDCVLMVDDFGLVYFVLRDINLNGLFNANKIFRIDSYE